MNDITALAKQLLATAEKANEHGEFNMAMHTVEVLALVEALEKAQQQKESDFEIKARLCKESNGLHDRLREADKRIAELESRTVTVKLTDVNEYLAEVHDKTLALTFRRLAEGVRAGDIAEMTAAGIQVIEGEG